MPNPAIFCNSPWYELQIYWDGSLGFCCQASHKIFPQQEKHLYNVQNMSIKQWFNSDPMRAVRRDMFGDAPNTFCSRCYHEETYSTTSRRHRSNQKSVIFTRSAFTRSYQQSPGHDSFEHSRLNGGDYDGMPIDLHIDLGNYCNLACKMCKPAASSRIAKQHKRWGIASASEYINTDWTRDERTWQRVLSELAGISNLRNIHFMGGETLLTKRFEDFVDFMMQQQRFDLNFSFVTNGTVFNEQIMAKLYRFNRVGIEVSIESLDSTNSYQRQGTDQTLVMHNLKRYQNCCDNDRISLTVRPAISLLTIGSYPELLTYAYRRQLIVKSLLVTNPAYLDVRVLPQPVKDRYLARYERLITDLDLDQGDLGSDYNESNPAEYQRVIKNQIVQCQSVLREPEPTDAEKFRADLVAWCRRWDDIYGYDAREIYPEFKDMLDRHGY